MRLERLDVAGFGSLHDVTLDFNPRLTLVLGDNESGKSTLHRAIRAALYGIDAGGQGRAVERSDWARWTPWTSPRYGIALTYDLEDGRRIRVARSFDTRGQRPQVLELGGSDLTDEVRSGRTVTPGRFHLGIDEAVFCATAWLGDDGLWAGSADAPAQRAANLQEAIERLADSRQGVTAAEAVKRLRDALQRVGTERRSTSQLGAAHTRLRDLDARLDAAQRKRAAVGEEQERLRRLEVAAAEAAHRRLDAARRWLAARIADVEARLEQLTYAADEASAHAGALEETRQFAAFPLSLEETVISLGGELHQATLAAAESEARWLASQEALAGTRRRRAEIGATLHAIDEIPDIGEETVEIAARLEGEVAALEAASTATRLDAAADSRIAALRREIAATGLGSIPAGAAAPIADLLRRQARGAWTSALYLLSTLLLVAAAAAAGVLAAAHQGVLLLLAAVCGAAAAAVVAVLARRRRYATSTAARRLEEVARGFGLSDGSAAQLRERLPRLEALQTALQQEEARVESRLAESEALHATAAALAGRCAALAGMRPDARAEIARAATTPVLLQRARESLARLTDAVGLHRRRAELEREDAELAVREDALRALEDEAEMRRDVVTSLQERLRQILVNVGMQPRHTPAESVAAVRAACDARRRHDTATAGLAEIQRRAAAFGSETDLRRMLDSWTRQLEKLGDTRGEAPATPLSAAALQELEHDAEHASQSELVANEQARELRSRLAAALENEPDIADLEDERDTWAAEVARALHRRAAIECAIELIEQASRRTHRDLAPQLAESVASRLSLLTDARYQAVNVDTEHFAVSLLGRDRPDMVPLEVTSHGTRDQVTLLLRLALCESLSGGSEPVPILLDEPCLTADPHRRETMLRFLHELSDTHQVIITAADPALAAVLRGVAGDEHMSVIELGASDAVIHAAGRRARAVRVLPEPSQTS